MLRSAQGQPLKPYQLAKEVLYCEPPGPGDEFSHIKRLGTKLKNLLHRVDLALSEDGHTNTSEDKRRVALKYIEYLMEPRDKFGLTRAEREGQRERALQAIAEVFAERLSRPN
jgi:hypothetical protein